MSWWRRRRQPSSGRQRNSARSRAGCGSNTAHQGPLPRPAVEAARHAADLKSAPHRIGDDDFNEVPERLRSLLARLVGSPAEQIMLGNSTSYGLHMIANGLPWRDGDEVLVIAADYPATVLPWQRLSERGVRVRPLRPASGLLSGTELAAAIGPRTRLLTVTWVDSFTGRARPCRARRRGTGPVGPPLPRRTGCCRPIRRRGGVKG